MLKNEPKVGDVIAFRLVSGDEIVGEVTGIDKDEVGIKKPCTLAMGPDGSVGLTPAALLGNPEKPVVYYRSQIMATMTPREDAVKSYQQFASGIVQATPQQTKNIVMPNEGK